MLCLLDTQDRFVSTVRASGYQAALTLIYEDGFPSFPPAPQRSRVVVTAVRKFRDTTVPAMRLGCTKQKHTFALSVLLAFYHSASLHCRIPVQRVLPPSTSGCWGCTVDAGGRVLVQVREAVLARGPFALIMLTLGHELVHACQILVGAHFTIVCDTSDLCPGTCS